MNGSNTMSLPIRYDGLDADSHLIDLNLLGESLQGLSRIINTVSHFCLKREYVKKNNIFLIRVYAKEIKANCVIVNTILQFAHQYDLFSGSGTQLLNLITIGIHYIISKRSKRSSNMETFEKLFLEKLDEFNKIQKNHSEKIIETMNNMSDGLKPSLIKTVKPIGLSCANLQIGANDTFITNIDMATKEAIIDDDIESVTDELTLEIRIDGLDLTSRACKIFIKNENDKRYRGYISDPQLKLNNNPYIFSLANKSYINVKAKGAIKQGEIVKYFISDTVRITDKNPHVEKMKSNT